ncbi:MAG: HAD-IA family hydrolase [Pseudomonadota bacterium]
MQTLPRGILFDLDGTLADTAPDLAAAIHRMQESRSLPLTPYATLRPFASAGARGLIGAAFDVTPENVAFESLKVEFLSNYASAIAANSTLFAGVDEMLLDLDTRGIQWGIVTNKAARFTDTLIPQIGLQHAGCVVSGDTTPHAKPHPAPLLEAAARLELSPFACWYVGDDLRDIEAGRAAGMQTLAAAWGYCGALAPEGWAADVVLRDPMALVSQLNLCNKSSHTKIPY